MGGGGCVGPWGGMVIGEGVGVGGIKWVGGYNKHKMSFIKLVLFYHL